MSLHVYNELEQGSDAWLAARCGLVTASTVGQLVTSRQPTAIETDCPECGALTAEPCVGKRTPAPLKTLHPARAAAARELDRVIGADMNSDTAKALVMTLVAERITSHVELVFPSRDMERGTLSEPFARDIYSENYAPASEIGFMVRDFGGYKIGFSPDGLVGDDGLLEIKAPRQKKHLATILSDEVPLEHIAQCQTGLLVSGREWIDFLSYNGGMPLWRKRVEPDEKWQAAIKEAVSEFEMTANEMVAHYNAITADLPQTERIDLFPEMEIY